MKRCTFIVGLVPLLLLSSATASTNKLFVVRNFLENASLAEPRLFYIRNNLDGDIEFQERENASLEVHLSAHKEDELDRVKVEYNLLDNDTIVDIQVYMIPETTTNWPLIGGLAGAGFVVVVIAVVILVCFFRRHRKTFKFADEKPSKGLEMRGGGKIVAEKRKTFETLKDAESKGTMNRDDEKNRKDALNPQRQSREIQEKIAIFDKQEPNDNGGNQGEKTCHQAKDRKVVGGIKTKETGDKGIKKKETGDKGIKTKETGGKGIKTKETGDKCIKTKETGGKGIKTKETGDKGIKTKETGDKGIKSKETGDKENKKRETGDKGIKKRETSIEMLKLNVPTTSRNSGTPRPQSSTFLSARAAFLVLTLIVVALATSERPRARIVITVPSKFVKNGSKTFFNKEFHGRLILPRSWKKQQEYFEQFAVSEASEAISSLESCAVSCQFACDVNIKTCICRRGYEMKSGGCFDIDECKTNRNNCHVKAMCNNTIGSFKCVCNDGYWGNGVTCQACSSTPCPQDFYQSEACSRTDDRKCTACTPKCEKTTYQAFGCGLTFDRKCVDISMPLTNSKAGTESDVLEVRRGSKLVVHKPDKDSVLLEDRLKLHSTSATFLSGVNSTNRVRLHRNSSFFVDVEIMKVDFAPKYNDYDRAGLNENLRFASDAGFPDIFSKYCRYPAANHYSVRHVLQPDRQTKVLTATCLEHSRDLCPDYTSPGEVYYYRSLNEACDTAETSVICPKPNQEDCKLEKHYSKLFCTNYTSVLNDLFGISEDEFLDSPLQSFSNVQCANAFRACRICRDECSQCTEFADNPSDSCSCCYKNCLDMCAPFYEESCTQIPKKCAKGDTSQFELEMDKPSWNTRFNCFLEYEYPTSLYSLRYRVRHSSGLFSSQWVSKTLELLQHDEDSRSKIRRGTNHLDALEVSHSTNVDNPPFLYLRGERISDREEYKYSVESLDSENTTLQRATGQEATILFQTRMPFALTTATWSDGGNCRKLADWSQIIRQPFLNLKAADVENHGRTATGAFSYSVRDAQYPPSLTVSISEEKSIFKYILTNASIRNDQTFRSSLSRQNTTWNAKISGYLTSCPGYLTLRVVDEVDQVEILEQDVVILCPETGFNLEVAVPRKNVEDNERLFSLFLTDAKQELKLQLALVDRGSRKGKESVENMKDDKPSPWIILMPVFVTTGCVLLALIGLMVYAQITHKEDESERTNGPPGWKRVKSKKDPKEGAGKDNSSKQESSKPKDPNRLKRRHLILVVFFVVVRVVYSLVFTFSMAFAILTLLHGSNLEVIQGYQSLLQRKVDESNAIALRMDQHREREIKRHLDSSEDIQRACDYFLGQQLQWLRYNMTCLIQENHLKMFNKLSAKIVEKTTEKIQQVKTKVKQRIEKFRADTNRKLQETRERVENYGRRVYRNGWFALPRAAYNVKRAFGRKKRDSEATHGLLDNQKLASASESVTHISRVPASSRVKRSIADSKFIGFLDFVGVLDQDKFAETERNVKKKLQYLKNGLADFSDVLKTGKSPEHPLTTIIMCPLRFMAKSAKETAKDGIKRLAEAGQEWAESQSGCVLGNVSDFFAANGSAESDYTYNETETESFSERVSYEEIEDSFGGISEMNESSLIESVRESSYYDIEKGDILEEMVDSQKEEILLREGKLKNVSSVYDAEVFIVTKKAVIGVLVVIDILLLIYRATSTYKTAIGLIEGFEETVEHDENEFQQEKPTVKQKANRLLRRVLDMLALKFSQFLTFCKSLHYRIMRTNFVPLCIAIAAAAAALYLVIVLTFNVLSVTAIEELGGYDMIAARLDSNFAFTNLAIDDHIDFINNNEMQFYKQTMNNTLGEYRNMVQDFNRDQQARMSRLNRQLCSLEEDKTRCLPDIAALLDFDPQTCIFPRLEGNLFEDYDGEEYRQRLKRDTKAFVDAIRNIVLETIYFTIAVVLLLVVIAALSYASFLFLKSRGMVRVRKVHVYKTLPPEILERFKLKALDADKESSGKEKAGEDKKDKKVKLDKIYLSDSRESLQAGESKA